MTKLKNINLLYLLISSIVFCFLCYRAMSIGITYDEAWTINLFVPLPIMEIINYTPCDANNHIVNTLLIKFFKSIFGDSLFVSRIPSLLGLCIYLLFSAKICQKYLNGILGICCFILLMSNPFLNDFFSLARGYGLAVACQIASLYYLLEYVERLNPKNSLASMCFGSLAVLSNFSWLNYFLVIILIVNLISIFHKENPKKIKIIYLSLIVFASTLVLIYEPFRKMFENKSLYYGGDSGIYDDTFLSLISYSLYKNYDYSFDKVILNSLFTFTFFIVALSFIFNRKLITLRVLFILIFAFSIVSIFCQHHLFGALYPINRSALFFYPIIILMIAFSLKEIHAKWFSTSLLTAITVLSIYNFGNSANVYKTVLWPFDAHSEFIIQWLSAKAKKDKVELKLDYSWPFHNSIVYYQKLHGISNIEIIKDNSNRDDINPKTNYFIFLNEPLEKVGYKPIKEQFKGVKQTLVKEFKNEHIEIYEFKMDNDTILKF